MKKKHLVCCVRISVYDKNAKEIFKKMRAEGSGYFSSFSRVIGARIAIALLKRCSAVLTPCSLIKNTLITLDVGKSKIKVLDHGIETEKIVNGRNFNKEFDICYFSRVEKNKGIWDFLEISKSLAKKNPNFKAVVLGDGSESKNVERFRKKERLEKNIILPGFVIGYEKFDFIKKSKVVLYPTYAREGWGLIVPETLCCGTPIISYDNEITKNVFGHLKSVFFIKTGDKNRLLKKTKKILRLSKQSYERLKSQSIKEGSSYGVKKTAKMEIAVLNNALKS